MRLRHGEVHVLYHGIHDRVFAQEEIFDFTPALQSGERVHVLKKEVLPLDRVSGIERCVDSSGGVVACADSTAPGEAAALSMAGVGDCAGGLSNEIDALPPIGLMGGNASACASTASASSDTGFLGSRATASICFHALA